ncbi:MAG: hypothetical protein MZV64_44695 [Ignavibacteriales bacterium]|nr:hypothetical protein [Ignavibacteriales bacterium]
MGHGGAAFPVGRKWAVIKLDDGQPHYLCANADEGEPGTFKDRWILENAPHLLLESMLIAGLRAAGAQLPSSTSAASSTCPTGACRPRSTRPTPPGCFGENILGTDFSCDIVVYRGAGSYVCGEASALITSIEGKKGYPRNRPPRLTVRGPVPAADGHQQRRDAVQHRRHHRARAPRRSARSAPPRARARSWSRSPATSAGPGVYEVEYGYPLDEVHLRGLRRHAGRRASSSASCPAASRPRC